MNDSTPPATGTAALATGSGAPARAVMTDEPDRPTGPLSRRRDAALRFNLKELIAGTDPTITAIPPGELTRLLERIQDYEKRVVDRREQLSRADAEALADALVLLLRSLAPFAPHFSEGLLLAAGREDDLESLIRWPEPMESLS